MARDIKLKIGGDIAKAKAALQELKRSGQDTARGLDGDFKSLGGTSERLVGSFKLLSGVIGGLSIGALAKGIFETTRHFETLNAMLITATGSAEGAEAAFGRLQTFAKETPYQLDEVVTAFIKLKNLGLDPSQESLRSYGNTASSMGRSLDQMIEAVADAATGEFERLKEFGIKARQQGAQVTLTFRGVKTTIGNNAAEIEGYLRKLGEVEFAGGMQRQMETLDGSVSNLKDSWESLENALGKSGFGDLAREGIDSLTEAINRLRKAIRPTVDEDLADLQSELQHTQEQLGQMRRDAESGSPLLSWLWGDPSGKFDTSGYEKKIAELQAKIADLLAKKQALDAKAGEAEAGTKGTPTTAPGGSSSQPAASIDYPLGASTGLGKSPFSSDNFNLGSADILSGAIDNSRRALDDRAAQEQAKALAESLATLRAALQTQNEAIESAYQDRLRIIQAGLSSQQLTADDAAELEKRAAQQREDDLTAIKERGEKQRTGLSAQSFNTLLSLSAQFAGSLAASQDQSTKKSFESYKAFAEAQAGISAALGVLSVWADSSIPSVYGKIAATVLVAGMTAVELAKIDSMQYQGGRATGGPVGSGKTYLVGERGPELLTMGEDGYVTPNDRLGGGGRVVQNIQPIINFNVSPGIQGAVQAEIMRAVPYMVEQTKGAVTAAVHQGGAFSQSLRRLR